MTDIGFLRSQAIQLRHLLDMAGDDPAAQLQLKVRLDRAEKQLADAEQQAGSLFQTGPVELPRAAIFLKGLGATERIGIRPELAGQTLISYENMFFEQAMHDEREAARAAGRTRRKRGSPKPSLLFTGTPRGSFGLEFVPHVEDAAVGAIHAKSLENVATALALVAESDSSRFEEAIGSIPHGVLPPLKRFLAVLSENDAEIRLAFSDKPSKSLSSAAIKQAAERLERDVTIETIALRGVFRGLTLDSGYFDFTPEDGKTITGHLADEMTEDDIDRISKLTNSVCKATLQRTTVTRLTNAVTHTHVLIDAIAEPTNPISSPAPSSPE